MREPPEYATYVRERSPRLLHTAYLLCRDRALAEDLLQTALAKAWRAWRRIDQDPDPYVYRIMFNTYSSWTRRRWRSEIPTGEALESAQSPDLTSGLDDRAYLWAALGRLPQGQRAVIVLRFFEDLTEAQTAAILGCAVGTVKSQASKALAKLRIDPEIVSTTSQGRS